MSQGESNDRSRASVAFFYLVLLAAAAGFLHLISEFITDLLLGFLVAAAMRSFFERLTRRLGGRRTLGALLTTLFVAVLVTVPLLYLVNSLSQQASNAYALVQHSLSHEMVEGALEPNGWIGMKASRLFAFFGFEYRPALLKDTMTGAVGKLVGALTPQLNALVSNLLSAAYHFVMMLLVVFYGLLDGPQIKQRVFDLSPLPNDEEELIVRKFREVWSAIVVGNGVASMLQGALGSIAMAVVGLPSPVFWGVVMSVFAFLPFVGISAVAIPAALYLVLMDRAAAAVGFYGFCLLQSVLIENVLKTKLMGDRMEMHSLLIFFSVLGGLGTFGLAGILYGPLLATFFLTIVNLYERFYRDRLFPAASSHASAPPPPRESPAS